MQPNIGQRVRVRMRDTDETVLAKFVGPADPADDVVIDGRARSGAVVQYLEGDAYGLTGRHPYSDLSPAD